MRIYISVAGTHMHKASSIVYLSSMHLPLKIIIMTSTSVLVRAALSCCLLLAAAGAASTSSRYNAIFNFGDSMSDTGNLCPDDRPSTAGVLSGFSHSPYGVTYFGKPTCRCCDGRVVVDFLAQSFGLPFLPPSKAHGKDFRRGANMAIVGGTVLDYTILQLIAYDKSINASLSAQIDDFQRLLPSICGTRENCKGYIAKSLFVFELGENDYNILLMNGSTIQEASKNIPNVVRTITSSIEKLITLGATDIVVSGVPPMGCYPVYLNILESSNKSDYDDHGCLRNYNALFRKHNSFLKIGLSRLEKKHQRTRIMYADLGGHIYQMVQHPKSFGLETTLASCCGKAGTRYRFDLLALCGMEGSTVCLDPSTHLIWDGMHLSDTANKRVADGWLNGPYCHPPILHT